VFTLINQTKKNEDIVKTITPERQESFHRPNTEQNKGLGFPGFARHEAIKNGGYLKDDVIFIKVEIEPFDLLNNQ